MTTGAKRSKLWGARGGCGAAVVSAVEGGCRDYSLKMKEAVPVLLLMGTMSPLLRRVGGSLKWGELLPEESL